MPMGSASYRRSKSVEKAEFTAEMKKSVYLKNSRAERLSITETARASFRIFPLALSVSRPVI